MTGPVGRTGSSPSSCDDDDPLGLAKLSRIIVEFELPEDTLPDRWEHMAALEAVIEEMAELARELHSRATAGARGAPRAIARLS
jgi:hypothetical protein